MDVINKTIKELYDIIMASVRQASDAGKLPPEPVSEFSVEIPADSANGDFSANVAMVNAKTFRMAPSKIAEIIRQEIHVDQTFIQDVQTAGPGFINFFVNDTWFSKAIRDILEQKENYGRSDFGKSKKINVEFVSANPTGPMHIGNARGGALGDTLAEVLNRAGYSASREFYINDGGSQMRKFGLSLNARYLQIICGENKVPFPEDGYKGADIIERAQAFYEIHGDKYAGCDETERIGALVDYALPLNIEELKSDLKEYRIEYDTWFKESILYKNNEVEKVIKLLTDKGATYPNDGALWFKATNYGGEQDFVLLRSNGIPTYIVPDIAYHYNKLETRGFYKAIDVLGADHHGYLPRLKTALKALGLDPDRLDFILMQMVRLIQDGEPVKASKRTGKSITLRTLIDEVPIDAARFFFNMREGNTHMDFDLDLAVEQSSKNPVYYVQYAYARICKILQKSGETPEDYSLLNKLGSEHEHHLIRKLSLLPSEIINAAKAYDPSRLTRYIIETAAAFHKFYDKCRVIGEEEDIMKARIMLCKSAQIVIKNVLTILKIEAPESM
ncbi:MAG: arginine--tRNA ligase [Oscillospiraceae bacterium]|nr:arginine--tRNA ligase [Oscillospiraceae bacterium]